MGLLYPLSSEEERIQWGNPPWRPGAVPTRKPEDPPWKTGVRARSCCCLDVAPCGSGGASVICAAVAALRPPRIGSPHGPHRKPPPSARFGSGGGSCQEAPRWRRGGAGSGTAWSAGAPWWHREHFQLVPRPLEKTKRFYSWYSGSKNGLAPDTKYPLLCPALRKRY